MGIAEGMFFEVHVVDFLVERDFTALKTLVSVHIDFSVLQLMRYNRMIVGNIMLVM